MFRVFLVISAVISSVICQRVTQLKDPFKVSAVPEGTLPVGQYRALTISGSRSSVNSVQDSTLDRLLRVYDPHILAGLWNRTTMPNTICHEEMGVYLKDLEAADLWAIRMADASGRYSGGFFWGNDYWLGSSLHCHSITDAPFPLEFFVVKAHIKIDPFPDYRHILLGVCLPNSCRITDVVDIVKLSSDQVGANHNRTILISSSKSPHDSYDIFADSLFWILVCVTILVGMLVAAGTFLELNKAAKACQEVKANGHTTTDPHLMTNGLQTENHQSMMRGNMENCSKTSRWEDIVMSFSAKKNLKSIFDIETGEDTISTIHGLRVITMGWVILLHSIIVTFRYSDNIEFRAVAEDLRIFKTIHMGTFAVDTFFCISGLLISFHYFRSNAKLDSSKRASGFKSHFLEFFERSLYRWVRLTVPYVYVMGITLISIRWLHYNSLFDSITNDHTSCEVYWWRNLLYVNNLFPARDMCMLWSWYLADDYQFFVLGIILLMLAVRRFRMAFVLVVLLIFSAWSATFLIAYNKNHMPNTDDPFYLFDEIYDKPWTRLGPYLVGMSAGWILFKTNCNIQINKPTLAVGWTLSIGVLGFLIYGLHNVQLSRFAAAAFSSLSHSAWAVSISWIVIVCTAGYGGWVTKILSASVLHPLSKLSYCGYLIHPVVQVSTVMTQDGPLHLQLELVLLTWIGHVVISYVASFVISLLFEVPSLALIRIIFPTKRRKPNKTTVVLQMSSEVNKKIE